jgi:uncharacterized membrane protein YesL
MFEAFRHFRTALSEFYYDLFRQVLLNVFWFLTALPSIFLLFAMVVVGRGMLEAGTPTVLVLTNAVLPALGLIVTLALAGPGTAAAYYVTNRLANGELFEPMRFWGGFRRFFWRGWALAVADAAVGGLLALNVWFYISQGHIGTWVLGMIFAYILVMWLAIQGYLFALLVEMNQSIRLVVRNALFLAIDNLGLTLGLLAMNLLWLFLSIVPVTAALWIPFVGIVTASNANNRAVVAAVERYRASGRIITDRKPE